MCDCVVIITPDDLLDTFNQCKPYKSFRSSNYYSTPGLQTPSTVNNSANYDISEWQREKERRRQELLAKRSKVMNRLLELRLEQEGFHIIPVHGGEVGM